MLKPVLLCSSVIPLAVGFVLLTATVTPSHPYRIYQTNGPAFYGNRGIRNNVPYNGGYNHYGYNGQSQSYTPYSEGNRGRGNNVPFKGNYNYGYNRQVQGYTIQNNISPYFNPSTGSYYGKGAAHDYGQDQQIPTYYSPYNQFQGGVYVSPSRTVITIEGGRVDCYNCTRNRPNTNFYR